MRVIFLRERVEGSYLIRLLLSYVFRPSVTIELGYGLASAIRYSGVGFPSEFVVLQ